GGGRFDRAAVVRGLDEAYGELRLPLDSPVFVEGPFGPPCGIYRLAPRDGEQIEPVEKLASLEIDRLTEVEVVLLRFARCRHAQSLLQRREVALKRRHR